MASKKAVHFFAGLTILIGLTVLCGWLLNNPVLKTVVPGFITMKVNTALLLITLAVSIILLRDESPSLVNRRLSYILSSFTISVSVLTLAEYLFNQNFGIDELLFQDLDDINGRFAPGRLAPITLSLTRSQSEIEILVTDQGLGISPQDHERIFQRFERAISEDQFSGLGLGLFVAKEIVKAHSGHIHVKSEPGLGAAFYVTLPLLES